jgi:adenylate cyclase
LRRVWLTGFVRWCKQVSCVWLSLGLSVLMALLYVFSRPEIRLLPSVGVLELLEAKTLDLRMRLRGVRSPGQEIVIIAIDEATEEELGRWQSGGRRWLAQLLDILHEGGAKVIGFDFTLAEPDRGAVPEAIQELTTFLTNDDPQIHPLPAELGAYLEKLSRKYDNDAQLTRAISHSGNVILGIYHFFNKEGAKHLTPAKHALCGELIERASYSAVKFVSGSPEPAIHLRHSFGAEVNLPGFSEAAASFGHFTLEKDVDGYVRRVPLLIEYEGHYAPSLGLEITRAYLQPTLPPLIHALGGRYGGIVAGIQLGSIFIPTDDHAHLMVNYYGPGNTFGHYSLIDVLRRRIAPSTFHEKIVLVGFTGSTYHDWHSTPFEPKSYPGVEVHATLIENILREDFLYKPGWTTLLDALITLGLGVGLGLAFQRMHSLRGALLTACFSLAGTAGLAYLVFHLSNLWLNLAFPLLFVVTDHLFVTSWKYLAEEKRNRAIRNTFEHYVSPGVVEQILSAETELKLYGEQKTLTAVFADIRGFTGISEKMSPSELVEFLNEFFTAMTEMVIHYKGTVDKYMGDAIMAFYGAPVEQPDHARRACQTAVDMLMRLKKLQIDWDAHNLPPLNLGIGINSGEMVVGNMGSEHRYGYTIMGDHVNLASRLEGLNKEYGTNIIISEFTYALIQRDGFTVRELDRVRVKGREHAITIYELLGYGGLYQQKQVLADMFQRGLAAYRDRQWDQAIARFQEVLAAYPDDAPSQVFLERCHTYQNDPPPEGWNGVFVMTTK